MTVIAGIIGTPADGLRIVGPFDRWEDANEIMEQDDGYRHGGDSWWTVAVDIDHADKWCNPLIQFARLLDEIQATGCLDAQPVGNHEDDVETVWDQLLASMDLNHHQLVELFERAQALFDEVKEKV